MTRSDDFLLTAEELRRKKQRRRRVIVGALALLLLIAAAFLLARPTARAIKDWQARRHASKAMRLIAAQDWEAAQTEAIAAYQLAPNEPAALRATARFLSRVRQPQAFEFWEKLSAQESLTRADLRDEAALALSLGETHRARTAIDKLLATPKEIAPADWLLAGQLNLQCSAPNESLSAVKNVFANSKATVAEQLQAAAIELRAAGALQSEQSTAAQSDAWNRIVRLSRAKDEAGLDGLLLLAQRALGQNAETLRTETLKSKVDLPAEKQARTALTPTAIADGIEQHPLAKAAQKLLAVDLRMHAAPNEKQQLITAAIGRWKNADNDSLGDLARWLNGHGEYERELDAIPLARALQTRELFLQHLDALGALGRWEQIRQLLESERFPLDPTTAHMYLARCYAQLGQKTASDNNWQRAMEAAVGNAEKLVSLGEYAGKNGATAIAGKAYEAATAATPKLRPAWQGRLRLAQATRDTPAINRVLAEMLKVWPNDSAIQNDEAYTRLLLTRDEKAEQLKTETQKLDQAAGSRGRGKTPTTISSPPTSDLPALEHLAESLVRREPSSLPHRTLLALVYLKENRPYTALELYSGLNVPASALTPSALAVHAAVLAATGNEEGAREEATKIPRSQLLAEERALLDSK